jgi:hypothetical protein
VERLKTEPRSCFININRRVEYAMHIPQKDQRKTDATVVIGVGWELTGKLPKSYHHWFPKIDCTLALYVDRSVNYHEYPFFSSSAREDGKQWLVLVCFLKKWPNPCIFFFVFSKAIFEWWIGITGSAVLSDELSILENLLHLVHLFYTSNLKVWFAL